MEAGIPGTTSWSCVWRDVIQPSTRWEPRALRNGMAWTCQPSHERMTGLSHAPTSKKSLCTPWLPRPGCEERLLREASGACERQRTGARVYEGMGAA